MGARKSLGEILVLNQKINIEQLEEAKKDQKQSGGRLTSALVRMGAIKDDDLAEFLSAQYGVPFMDLDNFEVDPDALKALTREICEKHTVIPVSRAGNQLVVAFADPSNLGVRDDLSFVSRCKIDAVVGAETSILKAIERSYKISAKKDINAIVEEMAGSDDSLNFTAALEAEMLDGVEADQRAPLVKFVNQMLIEAVKTKASDIHIEPYEKRLRIRYRIDGALIERIQPPPGVGNALSSRIKIMSRLDIAERRRIQDGRLKVKTANGMEVDFRVSVMPVSYGEKIVMRILDKSNLKLDMTKLGFDDDQLKVFMEAINQPQGMVLVTGPTGSGKTTTLYSALAQLNDPQVNISTAEDPVEFSMDGINQVQVDNKKMTFADALKSFLRQDPDIILVGEIRDYDTGEVAFKAASTGHLVLSTLHTNDAPGTVSRLLDMGIPGYLITSTVSLILAQRLAGKICEKCKSPAKVDPDFLIGMGVSPADVASYQPMKGDGCSACNGLGRRGRVAIYEVMTMSDILRNAIVRQATPVEIKEAAIKGGMRSLRQSALMKLKDGLITVEEVMTCTVKDSET